MKIDFSRKYNSSYLILSGEQQEDQVDYRLKMITENQIDGYLPCRTELLDGEFLCYYDITSKISLKTLFSFGPVTKKLLETLFRSMERAFQTAGQYLLPETGLLLRTDLIFTNVEQNKIWFCYYPGMEDRFEEWLKTLGEEILPKLDHSDREGVMLGYAFYQKCISGIVEQTDLEELLVQCTGKKMYPHADAAMTDQRRIERDKILDSFFSEEEEKPKKRKKFRFRLFQKKEPAVAVVMDRPTENTFGQTLGQEPTALEEQSTDRTRRSGPMTMTGASYATMDNAYLSAGPASSTYLPNNMAENTVEKIQEKIQEKTAEKTAVLRASIRAELVPSSIWYQETEKKEDYSREDGVFVLKGQDYVIGKSRLAADFVISNSAVSRVHARISWDGDAFTIEDINSKNATRVNGEILPAGSRRKLEGGDEILFADAWYKYIRFESVDKEENAYES